MIQPKPSASAIENQILIQKLYCLAWGVFLFFHMADDFFAIASVFGEPFGSEKMLFGTLSLVLGFLGIALIVFNPNIWLMIAAAVVQLTHVWMSAPAIDNHWVLGGILSLAVLVAIGYTLAQSPANPSLDKLFPLLIPLTMLVIVTTYPFAAFSKWNSAFLNPDISCAVHIFERGYSKIGLDTITRFPAVRWGLISAGIGFESIIAILLLIPKTRHWGAMLGIWFHMVLAMDPGISFFDFTSLLYMLFLFCMPENVISAVAVRALNFFHATPRKWYIAGWFALLISVPLFGITVVGGLIYLVGERVTGIAYMLIFFVWVVREFFMSEFRWKQLQTVTKRYAIAPAVIVIGAGMLMGLSPWLEIQTEFGLTMYSNLRVINGETNHLIIRKSWPVGRGHADLITFSSLEDENVFSEYFNSNWLYPAPLVRHMLAEHPHLDAEITRNGRSTMLQNERDLFAPQTFLQAKFRSFEPVPLSDSTDCYLHSRPYRY